MNRPQLLMAATAAVLVLLVLLFANPFRDSLEREDREWSGLFDPGKVSGTDRIRVVVGGDTTVVAKRGEEWVVASEGDFPADTAAVGTLLRAVEGARSAGVASSNPENRAKFQVDLSGVRVDLFAGNRTAAAFTLGKMGTDFTTSYVLPEGSNDVHVVRGMNRNLFARPQGMRDRTLLRFEPATVAEITARLPEGGWVLSRSDTVWSVRRLEETAGRPAQAAAADQLARSLGNLAADGIVDALSDTLDTGLAAPTHVFTVRLMNGAQESVQVGKKNDRNQYYVARAGKDVVYTLGEWRLTNLAKKIEELAAPPAAAN